jgi:hypothetical protein
MIFGGRLMSNLPKQILLDIEQFASKGLYKVSEKCVFKAKPKARLVRFSGEMERNISLSRKSKDKIVVSANSDQAGKFEIGWQGSVPITPLLENWAEVKKVRLHNPQPVDYSWTSKKVIKEGVEVELTRPNMQKFMFNSIPNEAEVKAELDKIIKSTLRGGTVYG